MKYKSATVLEMLKVSHLDSS